MARCQGATILVAPFLCATGSVAQSRILMSEGSSWIDPSEAELRQAHHERVEAVRERVEAVRERVEAVKERLKAAHERPFVGALERQT